jgi:hypothetical protein
MTDDAARSRHAEINQRARRAFLEGAAEEWARADRRPPTEDEPRRILARYPGDPAESGERRRPEAPR